MYIYVYIYICIYIHICICIHTYTHTQIKCLNLQLNLKISLAFQNVNIIQTYIFWQISRKEKWQSSLRMESGCTICMLQLFLLCVWGFFVLCCFLPFLKNIVPIIGVLNRLMINFCVTLLADVNSLGLKNKICSKNQTPGICDVSFLW